MGARELVRASLGACEVPRRLERRITRGNIECCEGYWGEQRGQSLGE